MKLVLLLILWELWSLQLFAEEISTFYIKPKSVLTSLEDNLDYLFEKGFYARAKLIDPHGTVYYIYDQGLNPRYTLESSHIEGVSEELNLLPEYDPKKNYTPQNFFRQNNSILPIESQLNLHFDNFQLSSLNEIYSDQIASVNSTRYEIRSFFLSSLPLQFGFGLNYQSAYWQNDIETNRLSILSLGPQIKYSFVKKEDFWLNALVSGELAPIYQSQSETMKETYSARLFDFGVEAEWKMDWGHFALGSHFRHHQIKLESSTRENLNIDSKVYGLNSIGIMLGYKLEWSL